MKSDATTLKELNLNNPVWNAGQSIQVKHPNSERVEPRKSGKFNYFVVVKGALFFSLHFIQGYSYSTLSELLSWLLIFNCP